MNARPLILIVDDEEQIRLFLRITLKAAGYQSFEAATGRAAIEACTGNGRRIAILVDTYS